MRDAMDRLVALLGDPHALSLALSTLSDPRSSHPLEPLTAALVGLGRPSDLAGDEPALENEGRASR